MDHKELYDKLGVALCANVDKPVRYNTEVICKIVFEAIESLDLCGLDEGEVRALLLGDNA